MRDTVEGDVSLNDHGPRTRMIVPFGFYGWGNIGDESTLQGFANLVRSRPPSPSVWVASRDPAHTKWVEPSFRYFRADRGGWRRRWAQYRANAAVFAGGTPIMDGLGEWPLNEVAPLVAAARERNQPIVFVGVGTERLRPESVRIVKTALASHVEHWSVRSERDSERLIGWGVAPDRVTVAADLAWLLPPVPLDFGQKQLAQLGISSTDRLVGLNVNNEPTMLIEQPRLFDTLAAVATQLAARFDARILFFCSEVREGETFDKAAALRVMNAMGRPDRAIMLPNRYWAPQQLASLLACCQFIISTRYHVCLLAAVQHVPFVAIQRSDKVRDLCSDIQWPHGLDLSEVRPHTLFDHLAEIGINDTDLRSHLRQVAERQARRSIRNALSLNKLG